jgi:hypothetical protein
MKKPGFGRAFSIRDTAQLKIAAKKCQLSLDNLNPSVKVTFTDEWCCFASGSEQCEKQLILSCGGKNRVP